ncbi:uncharacterized protein RSE6_03686 [Rhynchosporium secalis]|uniref:Uncharacterized protein n=1 Tax=Rhynchosporium secalis TaxID=38038 RepID=A0A1E1M4V9_RHYSE|nr:uncharacterized protein RSE6_03686 [Rhynchosporium secalis]
MALAYVYHSSHEALKKSFHYCSDLKLPTLSRPTTCPLLSPTPLFSEDRTLNENHIYNEARNEKYDDEKSLLQDLGNEVLSTQMKAVQHSVELEPMYEYKIEMVEEIAREANHPSETEVRVGSVTVIDPSKEPIAGISLGTSKSEGKDNYCPTLRAARLCENRPVCPNEQCRNTLEIIQQALPGVGGRMGKEMVIFRQEAKDGVWVDVAVDITPKIDDLRGKGYKRSAKGRSKDLDAYTPLDTYPLAWFDCTSCGKYKFRYQMDVMKGRDDGQAKEEKKDTACDKGELVFTLHRLESIKNKKEKSLARILFGDL